MGHDKDCGEIVVKGATALTRKLYGVICGISVYCEIQQRALFKASQSRAEIFNPNLLQIAFRNNMEMKTCLEKVRYVRRMKRSSPLDDCL